MNGCQAEIANGANYQTLTNLMDAIQGVGARISGQPYDVYRVCPTSTGDVIQPTNKVGCCAYVWRELLGGKAMQGFESAKEQKIYFFMVSGDFRCYKVGDSFMLTNPVEMGRTQVNWPSGLGPFGMPAQQLNGFVFAHHPWLKMEIGARIDRYIQIYRPATTTASGYLDTTFNGANPLILEAGQFILGQGTFGDGAYGSNIPAGLMPMRRPRGQPLPEVPNLPEKTIWSCYVPPLPYWSVVPGDMIIDSYSQRYRVTNPGRQDVGIVGNLMEIELEVSAIGYPN